MNVMNQRVVGVTKADSQTPTRTSAPNLTLLGIGELRMFAISYADKGEVRQAMVCQMNDSFYLAPDSETWVKKLKELHPKLVENIQTQLSRMTGTPMDVDLNDDIDIVTKEG